MSGGRERERPGLPGAALAVLAAALVCGGCERHVHVTMEMTWECLGAQSSSQVSDLQPVRFRYLEDPAYFDDSSGRGLCRQLRASGNQTAQVAYEVWGYFGKLHGYRIERVNGKPLEDFGGQAGSGYEGTGTGGPHPLAKALN